MISVHESLRRFLHAHSGICLGPEKDYLIDSRLPLLLRQHGLSDGYKLVERLNREPQGPVASALISALATHETFWFRDQRAFDALREHLLPMWRARDTRQLSIWSAACSSGQEIYSIAMLLAEEGLCEAPWQAHLLASDICSQSLQQAQEGRYAGIEIERGLPEPLLHRHFRRDGAASELDPRLRQRVRFERINLLHIPYGLGPFDAIFCRNVLIYFDRPTQIQVLQALHARLAPGGSLFLGPAESPLGLCDGLFIPGPAGSIYCKA